MFCITRGNTLSVKRASFTIMKKISLIGNINECMVVDDSSFKLVEHTQPPRSKVRQTTGFLLIEVQSNL